MPEALEGRTAIVTGAGGGVGRAIAWRFVRAGARVMLTDTNDEGLDETMAGIESETGKTARFARPIADKLGVTNLIAATIDAFGRIDVLVTDTNVSFPGGMLDVSAGDFGAAMNANVHSVFLQCQMVARRMTQQREEAPEFSGAMVNRTSIAAQRTGPELLTYSVCCAALDQLTRSMAVSLAPERIRVNAVALGSMMTPALNEALRERDALRDEVVAVTPLGRIGEAAEAAEAALFLASPAASFITGQIVAVDGGRLALDPLAAPVR
jgi:7-alpha-hydroxysteroid dehydrogenase